MNRKTDDETEAPADHDIAAFLGGQLDPRQRFEMVTYLADHPEHVAQVMTDLRIAEGLKLALSETETPVPSSVMKAADRLNRAMIRRRLLRRLLPVAASIALFALGWTAHDLSPSDLMPEQSVTLQPIVDAALDAEDAVNTQMRMVSQPETLTIDPQEISANLGIEVPDLPAGWIIRDVQVVATPDRPAVAIMLDTPTMGRIMLFSVVNGATKASPPNAFDYQGKSLAVFERGHAAYVLVDNSGDPVTLSNGARTLLNQFN